MRPTGRAMVCETCQSGCTSDALAVMGETRRSPPTPVCAAAASTVAAAAGAACQPVRSPVSQPPLTTASCSGGRTKSTPVGWPLTATSRGRAGRRSRHGSAEGRKSALSQSQSRARNGLAIGGCGVQRSRRRGDLRTETRLIPVVDVPAGCHVVRLGGRPYPLRAVGRLPMLPARSVARQLKWSVLSEQPRGHVAFGAVVPAIHCVQTVSQTGPWCGPRCHSDSMPEPPSLASQLTVNGVEVVGRGCAF